MKKLLALFLSLAMLLGLLCACSEEKEETETIKPLRKEVVEAYETDEKLAKEVQALFKEFDKAFDTLSNSEVDDAAFLAYAEAIDRVVHDFDAFDNYENNFEEYFDLSLERLELLNIRANLHGKLYDYESGEGSAEGCAEAAFGVVNSYSEFFYGEYRFTDDDLDKLG